MGPRDAVAVCALIGGAVCAQPQPEVIDVRPGSRGSNPQYLTSYGDRLVFRADDGVAGDEPWSYNGGGLSLTDLLPGPDDSFPAPTVFGFEPFPEFQGALYFSARGPSYAYDLWRYDATGTVTRVAVPPVTAPAALAVAAGELFFRYADGITGNELWGYDGVSARRLYSGATMDNLTEYDGRVYLQSHRGDLLAYDGETVAPVFDAPGTAPVSHANMVVFQGDLYFVTRGASEGQPGELWRFDGSTATQVTDLFVNTGTGVPRSLTVLGDRLCFTASTEATGQELWCYDGSGLELHDILPGVAGSDPRPGHRWRGASRPFHVYDGALYFSAVTADVGRELWRFDGATPTLAADIDPGPGSSSPESFVEFEGALYFQAEHGLSGEELWRFDGTEASLVAELAPGSVGGRPEQFTVHQGDLYFVADDDVHGKEVFRLPGSAAPPPLVLAVSEVVGVVDAPRLRPAARLEVLEIVGVDDATGVLPALRLAVTEAVGVTDEAALAPALLLAVREVVGVSDGPAFREALLLRIQETLAVDDASAFDFSVDVAGPSAPSSFAVGPAAPNPADRLARVRFTLPTRAHVRIEVYDPLGRRVAVIVDRDVPAGEHVAPFDATAFAVGTYFLRFQAGPFVATRPLNIVR